jgi:hypothetical protein
MPSLRIGGLVLKCIKHNGPVLIVLVDSSQSNESRVATGGLGDSYIPFLLSFFSVVRMS